MDGAELAAGAPVRIMSHAYAPGGVAEVSLSVNGREYRREPPAEGGASFVEITQEWFPEGPGEYAIQVKAYDAEGEESAPSTIRVKVVAEMAAVPTASPTATPSPSSEGTAAPTDTPVSPTDTPLVPTDTPPSPTDTPLAPTDTPLSPTDTPIPPTDTPLVPSNTPSPQPDTTPPTITDITESDDPVRPPDCDPDSVTISARITDPSGVAKTDLYYRVVRGSQEGAWFWTPMSPGGGETYQVEIGHDQLKNSLFPYEGDNTRLEYYIKVWDSKANMAQSPTQQVTVIFCVP